MKDALPLTLARPRLMDSQTKLVSTGLPFIRRFVCLRSRPRTTAARYNGRTACRSSRTCRPSGMMMPAAASMAHRAWMSSFARYFSTWAGSWPKPSGSYP